MGKITWKKKIVFSAVVTILLLILSFGLVSAQDDHGDSIGTATPIRLDTEVSGQMDSLNDKDFFSITVSTSGKYQILLKPELQYFTNYSTKVFDKDGNIVNKNQYYSVYLNANEKYYLEISNKDFLEINYYKVTVKFAVGDYKDNISDAKSLQIGTGISSESTAPGKEDYYKFTTDKEAIYTIKYTGRAAFILLYDQSSNFIAAASLKTPASTCFISERLPAGCTYLVAVRDNALQEPYPSPYTLSVDYVTDDFGDSFDAAKEITNITSGITESINCKRDIDFIKFTVPQTGYYAIESNSNIPLIGELFGSSANKLESYGANNTTNFHIYSKLNQNETYYLSIRSPQTNTLGSYIITAKALPANCGNDMASATSITTGSSITGNLEDVYSAKYYCFTAEKSENHVINCTGAEGIFAGLYDENGNYMVSDVRGTGYNYATLASILESNKKYYIKVQNSTTAGAFSISISTGNDDFSNDITNAGVLPEQTEKNGNLEYVGDADFFEFTPQYDAYYNFEAKTDTGLYTSGYIYNSDGTLLCRETATINNNGSYNFVIRVSLKKGNKYFVKVCSEYEIAGSIYKTGNYTLTAKYFAPDDHGNTFNAATPIKEGTITDGCMDIAEDEDMFVFVPAKSGKFLFRSMSTQIGISNIYLSGILYDQNGRKIFSSYENASNQNFTIEADLTEGQTYYLKAVNKQALSTGNYQIEVACLASSQYITLQLKNSGNTTYHSTSICYLSKDNKYTTLYGKDITIKQISETDNLASFSIVFNNLDWTLADKYYVWVSDNSTLYKTVLTKELSGKTITLDTDASFVNVNVNIPFSNNGFTVSNLVLNHVFENGDTLFVGQVIGSGLIPQGKYNIQVNAYDDSNTYNLFKKNSIITNSQNTISFSKDDISEFNVSLQALDQSIPSPVSNINLLLSLPNLQGFNSLYGFTVNSADSGKTHYISKAGNQKININFMQNSIHFMYSTPDINTNANFSVVLDQTFKAKINADKPYYLAGTELNSEELFGIYDSHGNKLRNIIKIPGPQFINTLEFSIDGRIIRTYPDASSVKAIKLPDSEGIYDCSCKTANSPIPVEPATKIIKIVNSLPAVAVQSVTVTGSSQINTKGGTSQMTAVIAPVDATDKSVLWNVLDENGNSLSDLAEVSTSGLVTAKKDGKVRIKATSMADVTKKGYIILTITNQADAPVTPPTGDGSVVPPPGGGPVPANPPAATLPTTNTGIQPEITATAVTANSYVEVKIIQKPIFNAGTGESKAAINMDSFEKALKEATADASGKKTIVFEIAKDDKAKAYVQELPSSLFSAENTHEILKIATDYGTIIAPANMLGSTVIGNVKNISLVITKADKSMLSSAVQAQIGSSPVIDLSVRADDKAFNWSNPEAPVRITIPYTPTAAELADPEHITVWYIDGSGNAIAVPSGKYDPATKTVSFTTTHFSRYAVAFVNKTYTDIKKGSWMEKPVLVLSSKGIMEGTSKMAFSPDKSITRGEFMMWLVNTLGLNATFKDNFSDVKSTDKYYNALGIAKKLGIAQGSGNNSFNPKSEISRQDMIVLTIKALKAANFKLSNGSQPDLAKFTDKAKIAKYAAGDVATMVKSGLISGSGKMLNPQGTTTRAEVAALLYKIYNNR